MMIIGNTHKHHPYSLFAALSLTFTTAAIMQLSIVSSANSILPCSMFTNPREILRTLALDRVPVGMTNQTLRNLNYVLKP